MQANASQSSLNSFSVRIYLPQTRNSIITAAKIVHHQQTRRVGLSSPEDRAGGGDEYMDMITLNCHARLPPQRGRARSWEYSQLWFYAWKSPIGRIPVGTSR